MTSGKENLFLEGLASHFSDGELKCLQNSKIGIAGAGGLGSNIALMLARTGIGKLLIIDYDIVTPSNLNRQQFWPRHLGKKKIHALAEILLELNQNIELELIDCCLTEANISGYLSQASIWAEALDKADVKTMFINNAVQTAALTVSGNGLCGIGGKLPTKKCLGNLHIAGDFSSGTDKFPPYAPRVIQTAAIMADVIIEYVLKTTQK